MATDLLDHLLEMADGQRRHLEHQAVGPGHVVTLQDTDVVNIAVLPYLAVRYGVDNIPTTAVNRRKACVGVLAEEEFVREIVTCGLR